MTRSSSGGWRLQPVTQPDEDPGDGEEPDDEPEVEKVEHAKPPDAAFVSRTQRTRFDVNGP
jgi:hypothetical protein